MEDLEQHLRSQTDDNAGGFWHRLRWRAMAHRVAIAREIDLLDVGAGTGILGELLSRERPSVRYNFLEPVQAFAQEMEARWGTDRNASARADFGAFSVVTLLDVIEHVPNDERFLAEILERVAPGTQFIVTVPALRMLWSQWDVALGHYRRYTRRSLREILGRLPVQIEEISYLFPELIPASIVNGRRKRAADAEWPRLPKIVDECLYRLGLPSVLLRRFWPAGTSLIAVFRST